MNYRDVSDKPMPRGEIVVGDNCVTAGYCNYVDNIMVHTDPMNSYCVTLVVASYGALEKWGRASRS